MCALKTHSDGHRHVRETTRRNDRGKLRPGGTRITPNTSSSPLRRYRSGTTPPSPHHQRARTGSLSATATTAVAIVLAIAAAATATAAPAPSATTATTVATASDAVEESDICVGTEHAELRERDARHTRLPRAGPVRTAFRIAVSFERHERVRSDFELRGQHARRQVGSQRENALQEACFARR